MPELNISIPHYIPSTLFGLLGLIAGYIFYAYSIRNRNRLNMLRTVAQRDRPHVMDAMLNEIGIAIDTQALTPEQKYNLLVRILEAKIKRQVIGSVTTILLAILVVVLILLFPPVTTNPQPVSQDSTNDSTAKNKRTNDTGLGSIPHHAKKIIYVEDESLRNFLQNNLSEYIFSDRSEPNKIHVKFHDQLPLGSEMIDGHRVWTYYSAGNFKILVNGIEAYTSKGAINGSGGGDLDSAQAFEKYEDDMNGVLERDKSAIIRNIKAKLNALVR
jgi:hypothetical protein